MNFYIRIRMAKTNKKLKKIHHCSVNNRNIWSQIVATDPSIVFLFSFFKMYIQNAAQWYNLNQYHVNKFLIRIKKTKQNKNKSHLLKHFSHTRNGEIKAIATNSDNWMDANAVIKERISHSFTASFEFPGVVARNYKTPEARGRLTGEKNEGRTPY